ncbi:hypothetical protein [Streptomyces sp. NPDC021212]|uniref:hypothetical protein n=1 Tax=Streptomyces sp. NPDC021212 TaxID=3365118 RepID=UPI00378CCD24
MTMMMRRWAAVATGLATSSLLAFGSPSWAAPSAPSSAAASAELPDPPAVGEARAELAELTVAPETDVPGYSRAKFPHWIIQQGTCDTRENVLARDGEDIARDGQCRAQSPPAPTGRKLTRWQPPLADYRCTYGRAWISVKYVYGLIIDTAECSALEGMLDPCA